MFHYFLFAHALGVPKKFCLNPAGEPVKCAPRAIPTFTFR